jgi:hypothetical protein
MPGAKARDHEPAVVKAFVDAERSRWPAFQCAQAVAKLGERSEHGSARGFRASLPCGPRTGERPLVAAAWQVFRPAQVCGNWLESRQRALALDVDSDRA